METANSLVMKKINTAAMRVEGLCYVAIIQTGIESDADGVSTLTLHEDGKPLPYPHSPHDDIRAKGSGRYSHWGNGIFFSSSDNTDPRENGRVYSWLDIEDEFDAEITPPFKHDGGNCWVAPVGGFGVGDDATGAKSMLFLLEDGFLFDHPHSAHNNIRLHGKGLYSHWGEKLYFSTTDNSDPNVNGRRYTVMFQPDYFFAQKASQAYSIAERMIMGAGGLNAVKGKTILEVGAGDMGVSLALAAMGCEVAVIEKHLPTILDKPYCKPFARALNPIIGKYLPAVLDKSYYRPLAKALKSILKRKKAPFDPITLDKIAEGRRTDQKRLRIFRAGMEEFPPELAGRADITISNAVLEHLERPDISFRNLYAVSKRGSIGLHDVDFRDHRDFSRPLEFLLADDEEFEKMHGYKYEKGNGFRKARYERLLKEAGFDEVVFTPCEIADAGYFADFLPRLRASKSRFRDLDEEDLRILGGCFRLTKN